MAEEKKPKIETCEGSVSLFDTLPAIDYLKSRIVLRVRGLTEEESLWMNDQIGKLNEIPLEGENKTIEIAGVKIEVSSQRLATDRLFCISQALHLGARERIADEGWAGIEAKHLVDPVLRKKYAKKEVPCTIETFMSLDYNLRTRIANLVSAHFNISIEGEIKNLSGR